MTAHDDLRRQLTGSVAERAPAARRGRGRGWRGPHRGLAVVVLALAFGSGVAGAATQLLRDRGPGDRGTARSLVQRAIIQTSALDECQTAPGRFVAGAARPEIAAVFPARTTPLPAELRAQVLRFAVGDVVTSSVRLVRFAAGERLLVYATQGADLFVPTDPAACDRAQAARLRSLHPEDDAIRELAREMLAKEQARSPVAQVLTISALGRHGVGGAGIPVKPGRPLPTGVVFHGGSSRATVYGGIAVAGARTVTLTTGPHSKHPLRRAIAVRERLFAFTLPRDTGPVSLRQRAADGTTLAVQRVRG